MRPDIIDAAQRQQVYAHGIIKDIENRSWYTPVRGRIFVHTSKRYSRRDHADYAEYLAKDFGIVLPSFENMALGGIVGDVEIVDCVKNHPSRWKIEGSWGFLLRDARPHPFKPLAETVMFFDVEL